MMSGAWPPPAPSVWNAWIVRFLKAEIVFSTKPLSFSVSVWIITWTIVCVGDGEAAIDGCGRGAPILVKLERAGAPQHHLLQGRRQRGVALARQADVHGEGVEGTGSCGRYARGPGVQVVASVPWAGPVPPPSIVVTPAVSASSICCGQMKMDMRVEAAARQNLALARNRLRARADDDGHAPGWVSGLPALPMPAIRPSFRPIPPCRSRYGRPPAHW